MRIEYDNVPDPSRVRVGDLLILPAENPDARKTRLSVGSIAKFGVSVGDTGRSSNNYKDVKHMIFNRCDIPLVLEVIEARQGGVRGWDSTARKIRDNRNLLCNDDTDGDVVGDVTLHYVNISLDDRFYPVDEGRGISPDEFFGCVRYKRDVARVLGDFVSPSSVMCPGINPCEAAADTILRYGSENVPVVPCAEHADANRLMSLVLQRSDIGTDAALLCIVDRFIGGYDKKLRASASFLSAMAVRGAKLVRPRDPVAWRLAYVRRIAERILLRVKENEIRMAKVMSGYAGKLLTCGKTSLDRAKLAATATKRLRVLADERRALDAFAEGK